MNTTGPILTLTEHDTRIAELCELLDGTVLLEIRPPLPQPPARGNRGSENGVGVGPQPYRTRIVPASAAVS